MSRRDDVNKVYEFTKKIENIIRFCFWGNILFSLIGGFLDKNFLIIVQILLSIMYVVLSILDDKFLWYEAERIRRQTCIENAFGINITEYKTEGYYNNSIQNDYMKFYINSFESIMFSKKTAGKMILKEACKTILIVFVFICVCLVFKNYGIILIISQAVFSAYFIEGFVSLCFYKSRLEKLYDNFYKELITIGINNENQKVLLLSYAIDYETIKAHYKIRLSQKEFNEHNDETSLEWEKISSEIKINI